MSIVYISGPVTGMPDNNGPAFEQAKQQLEEMGHLVVEHIKNNPETTTKERAYRRALKYDIHAIVSQCDGIAVLPGFETSRGAMLEILVARALGIEQILLPDQDSLWKNEVDRRINAALRFLWSETPTNRYTHHTFEI